MWMCECKCRGNSCIRAKAHVELPYFAHTALTSKSPETRESLPGHIPSCRDTCSLGRSRLWGQHVNLFGYLLPMMAAYPEAQRQQRATCALSSLWAEGKWACVRQQELCHWCVISALFVCSRDAGMQGCSGPTLPKLAAEPLCSAPGVRLLKRGSCVLGRVDWPSYSKASIYRLR